MRIVHSLEIDVICVLGGRFVSVYVCVVSCVCLYISSCICYQGLADVTFRQDQGYAVFVSIRNSV